MSSFHHSRARIAFDTVCALGISASCVAAWTQTYASAMLGSAAIAGLYGLVRAFDMRRRNSPNDESVLAAPARVGDASHAVPEREPQPEPEPVIREVPLEELVGEPVKQARKAPRKKAARVRKTREQPALAAIEAAREDVQPEPVAEPEPELHVVDSTADQPEHLPVTPLFEAEPFLRHQRAAFGRKARG
jgi:hypothetical protein